jgi:hypothetical protein
MKINGKNIDQPNEIVCVIPRNNGDIVFKARAVLDYTIFTDLCKRPIPKMIMKRGEKEAKPDIEDKEFIAQIEQYSETKINYMIVQSLGATEGLEWDTVKMTDPTTWGNYDVDLKKSCFTDREIDAIISAVFDANGLNEARIEEARKRFLQSAAQAQ